MSRVVFKISAGFLVGALALLATALYLSGYYIREETRLAAAGDMRGALEASRTAARLDPFSPLPLQGQSYLLEQRGLDEEAAGALREAIERDPNNYILYLSMGNLQVTKLDDLDAAEENYRKVLELNPNDTIASNALAQVLVEKGELEGAREEYEKLRKEGELSYHGLYNLGRIYVRTGEPREGFETIRLARRKASAGFETPEGQRDQRKQLIESMSLALADALVVQGDYASARRIIARSSSEQAPALLHLLDADPQEYRETVVNSEIY